VERLMASSVLPARSAASSRAPPSPTPQASRPADLVERQVTAQRPNALWVADLTYIRTWSDYAALVIDAFSRAIVGWQLAGHLRTDLALDAPEMAIWQRNAQLDGLVHPATTMGSNQAGLRCRCRRRGPKARRTRPLHSPSGGITSGNGARGRCWVRTLSA
jgi:putative transposase